VQVRGRRSGQDRDAGAAQSSSRVGQTGERKQRSVSCLSHISRLSNII